MSEAIRAEQLSKRYFRHRALDNLSLSVPENCAYALVGPNGAGKSSLIKILMNLIQASSGSASVLGVDSTKIRGEAFTQIGYVSENQRSLDWMRVGEVLEYLRPFYPKWDESLGSSLLKQFDLPRDRKIKALSRGMKMKLALASSLAFRPKLIVLDEPFGGLDPLVRDQLIECLIQRDAGTTIFLSSHDLNEIESFANYVGYLEDGKLRFSESMGSLLSRFREIELNFDQSAPLMPPPAPASWLQIKPEPNRIRFVESQFEEERTQREIALRFPGAPQFLCKPMSLRAIFLVMARSASES